MSKNIIRMDAVVHTLNKAIVLVEAMIDAGATAEQALEGSHICLADFNDHMARMSTRQLLTICRNAVRLIDDPLFAMKAGLRVHVSHFGILGFAMMASETYRDALDILRIYRFLSTPLIERDFYQNKNNGKVSFVYRDYLGLDENLFRFVLEFQIGSTRTTVDEIFGGNFQYIGASLTFTRDQYAAEREALLGVPIEYGSKMNQLIFDSSQLNLPLPGRQRNTAATLHQMCEKMIGDLCLKESISRRVASMLVEKPGHFPGIEEIASRLHMTSRTLRRKLLTEDTCYADLLISVRKNLAVHYLQTTQMKTDAIARLLGFSDSANFRHAFKKWTSRNPSDFRYHNRDIRLARKNGI